MPHSITIKSLKVLILTIAVWSPTSVFCQSKLEKADATLSYDYAQIAPHPRLLLKSGEENEIKKAISQNSDLKSIHDYIIQQSDLLMSTKPVRFKKEGRRLLFVSRDALQRLFYLSYAYRMTQAPKYLLRAEKELLAVSNFKHWNHHHFLDVGEMSMAVAIAYDWLYKGLSANTRKAARNAMNEFAFNTSYIKKNNWFLTKHSNWNSVCNGGLVFGALATLESHQDISIKIIERALESAKLPLKAYGPDGNYPEGPGYWNYGTTYQALLHAGLESALGHDNGLSDFDGFMKTPYYQLMATGTSGKWFNYYDNRENVTISPILFWFANKLNNPSLLIRELKFIREGRYTEGSHRFLPLVLIYGRNLNPSATTPHKLQFFSRKSITPIALVKTSWEENKGHFFGIKGGSASDHHAHMDQGSFVYDIGTVRWALDLGRQEYNSLESRGINLWNKAQDSDRWKIFRYNNFNHNTLSINGQLHNAKGRAEMIEVYDSQVEQGASVDLTEVLNRNGELKSAVRKGVLVNEKHLKIVDTVETNEKEEVRLRWNMATKSEVEIIDKNTIKLTQKNRTLWVTYSSNVPFTVTAHSARDPSKLVDESTGKRYPAFNHKNPGVIMIGFDAVVGAGKKAEFITVLREK